MSGRSDQGYGSVALTATVNKYERVTHAGALAGVGDLDAGIAMAYGVSGDEVGLMLLNKQGTAEVKVDGAVTQYDPIYQAASGLASSTQASGAKHLGYALDAATTSGDIVEFIPVGSPGAGSNGILAVAQQTLAAGGGAVTVNQYYTAGASDAGGDAWTLADGTFDGQLKKIQLVTDGGGDAVLTPTNLDGGTTITFADAGDYAVLVFSGGTWVAVELGNDADGATAPVLA